MLDRGPGNRGTDQYALSGFFRYQTGLSGLGDCSDPGIVAKIYAYADQYGIDRNVALNQIRQESNCSSTVCSNKGACGIAQFMPGTAAQYGLTDRRNVDASLNAWGKYMSYLLSLFGGDYRKALAGYNWGEGNVQKKGIDNLPAETANYLARILGSGTPANGGGSTDAGSGGTAARAPLPLLESIGAVSPWVLAVAGATALYMFSK